MDDSSLNNTNEAKEQLQILRKIDVSAITTSFNAIFSTVRLPQDTLADRTDRSQTINKDISKPSVKKCCNVMCQNVGQFNCSKCKAVGYCNAKCQKKDWPYHKLICKYVVQIPPTLSIDSSDAISKFFYLDSVTPARVIYSVKCIDSSHSKFEQYAVYDSHRNALSFDPHVEPFIRLDNSQYINAFVVGDVVVLISAVSLLNGNSPYKPYIGEVIFVESDEHYLIQLYNNNIVLRLDWRAFVNLPCIFYKDAWMDYRLKNKSVCSKPFTGERVVVHGFLCEIIANINHQLYVIQDKIGLSILVPDDFKRLGVNSSSTNNQDNAETSTLESRLNPKKSKKKKKKKSTVNSSIPNNLLNPTSSLENEMLLESLPNNALPKVDQKLAQIRVVNIIEDDSISTNNQNSIETVTIPENLVNPNSSLENEVLPESLPKDYQKLIKIWVDNTIGDANIRDWRSKQSNGNILYELISSEFPIDEIYEYLVALFIEKVDFPLDSQNNDGNTCLHLLAMKDNINISKLLLDNGADMSICNTKNLSPKSCTSNRELLTLYQSVRDQRKKLKMKQKMKLKKEKQLKNKSNFQLNDSASNSEDTRRNEEETIINKCSVNAIDVVVEKVHSQHQIIYELVESTIESLKVNVASSKESPIQQSKAEEPLPQVANTNNVDEGNEYDDDNEDANDDPINEESQTNKFPLKQVFMDNESEDVWEIEITKEARQQLQTLDSKIRNLVAHKIDLLAQGKWTRVMVKPTTHTHPDLKLYRSKFSKGGRIIWELGISYSSKILCYCEVIRIWAIVADHEKQSAVIDRITESHRKGKTSNVSKSLQNISSFELQEVKDSNGNTIIRPRCFRDEETLQFIEDSKPINNDDSVMWYPPAVPSPDSYVLMKFYECTKGMMRSFVNEQGLELCDNDFPFRLSPLEHEVCSLKHDKSCSILLIGRSGCGKTTVLGHRLFFHYKEWYHSPSGGNKLLSNGTQDLNQVFITANPVLRNEVRKFFRSLVLGETGIPVSKESQNVYEFGLSSPSLSNIAFKDFPLFLTKREWLVLLDGTLDRPFFPRVNGSNGELESHVSNVAWGRIESESVFGLLDCFILEDADDKEEEEHDISEMNIHSNSLSGRNINGKGNMRSQSKKTISPSRYLEIDYAYFNEHIFPQITNTNAYSSSLVWCEIMSFIKGSKESMDKGFISEQQYNDIGKKRAPNFQGCRSSIYYMFKEYDKIRRRLNGFDLCDVIYHICHELRIQYQEKRLSGNNDFYFRGYTGTPIHELYVDEVQDFMEAEVLLMTMVSNPNGLFLTGDDAQTIARGLSFRFTDIRSIFWSSNKVDNSIQVPKLMKLINNYRTHSGILNLANSIIDMIHYFFPSAIDKLPHDIGLFDGPKPWILKTANFDDLIILLLGSDRQTQIEFGAQQCVIVRDVQSKKSIPLELIQGGLVCSIFESKGLEFNDVLLYNFFTDSPAKHMWRCVMSLLIQDDANASQVFKTRALEFDETKHKILLEELRHLYTAITRARVNVWIYDESPEFRGPMFEYLEVKNLVRVVSSVLELDELSITKGSVTSQEEWIGQGRNLFEKQAYYLAHTCFLKGKDFKLSETALAHAMARDKPPNESEEEMIHRFKESSIHFLRGSGEEMSNILEAAACLKRAKEYKLASKLFLCVSGASKYAARCLEEGYFYLDAGKIYLSENLPKYAMKCFRKLQSHVDILASKDILINQRQEGLVIDLLLGHNTFELAYEYQLQLLNDEEKNQSTSQVKHKYSLDDLALKVIKHKLNQPESEMIDLDLWFNRVSSMTKLQSELKNLNANVHLANVLFKQDKYYEGIGVLCDQKKKLLPQTIEKLSETLNRCVDPSNSLLLKNMLVKALVMHNKYEEAITLISSNTISDETIYISIDHIRNLIYEEVNRSSDVEASTSSSTNLRSIIDQYSPLLVSYFHRFLTSKSGWGLFWAMDTLFLMKEALLLREESPYDVYTLLELEPQPQVEADVEKDKGQRSVLVEALACISTCISNMTTTSQRETKLFLGFEMSATRKGYVSCDRYSRRIHLLLQKSIPSEVESNLTKHYICYPQEQFIKAMQYNIFVDYLTTNWKVRDVFTSYFSNHNLRYDDLKSFSQVCMWIFDFYQGVAKIFKANESSASSQEQQTLSQLNMQEFNDIKTSIAYGLMRYISKILEKSDRKSSNIRFPIHEGLISLPYDLVKIYKDRIIELANKDPNHITHSKALFYFVCGEMLEIHCIQRPKDKQKQSDVSFWRNFPTYFNVSLQSFDKFVFNKSSDVYLMSLKRSLNIINTFTTIRVNEQMLLMFLEEALSSSLVYLSISSGKPLLLSKTYVFELMASLKNWEDAGFQVHQFLKNSLNKSSIATSRSGYISTFLESANAMDSKETMELVQMILTKVLNICYQIVYDDPLNSNISQRVMKMMIILYFNIRQYKLLTIPFINMIWQRIWMPFNTKIQSLDKSTSPNWLVELLRVTNKLSLNKDINEKQVWNSIINIKSFDKLLSIDMINQRVDSYNYQSIEKMNINISSDVNTNANTNGNGNGNGNSNSNSNANGNGDGNGNSNGNANTNTNGNGNGNGIGNGNGNGIGNGNGNGNTNTSLEFTSLIEDTIADDNDDNDNDDDDDTIPITTTTSISIIYDMIIGYVQRRRYRQMIIEFRHCKVEFLLFIDKLQKVGQSHHNFGYFQMLWESFQQILNTFLSPLNIYVLDDSNHKISIDIIPFIVFTNIIDIDNQVFAIGQGNQRESFIEFFDWMERVTLGLAMLKELAKSLQEMMNQIHSFIIYDKNCQIVFDEMMNMYNETSSSISKFMLDLPNAMETGGFRIMNNEFKYKLVLNSDWSQTSRKRCFVIQQGIHVIISQQQYQQQYQLQYQQHQSWMLQASEDLSLQESLEADVEVEVEVEDDYDDFISMSKGRKSKTLQFKGSRYQKTKSQSTPLGYR